MQAIKLLGQMTVLSAVYACGELAVRVTRAPLPGSVAGMGILLLLLAAGWMPADWVEEASNLLLKRLTLLFLPLLIGLGGDWPLLRTNAVPLLVVVALSTAAVLLGSAAVTVLMGRRISRVGS